MSISQSDGDRESVVNTTDNTDIIPNSWMEGRVDLKDMLSIL